MWSRGTISVRKSIAIQKRCVALKKKMSMMMISLNDGNFIPKIGLGTFQPDSLPCDAAIVDALEAGYRLFDVAYFYGNQREFGVALKKGLDKFALKRSDVFVTTKVWNTFHERDNAVENCRQSLEMLQLDYVDLLQIHTPLGFQEGSEDLYPVDANGKIIYSDVDYLETWKGLEECVNRGWAKSIGVCNFSVPQLERVLANCVIKPAVNQVEGHPYFNQEDMINFCSERGIVVQTFCPLAGTRGNRAIGGGRVTARNLHVLDDIVLLKIAANRQRTPAQIVLRWAIQRGTIPIPRSTNKHRLRENFDIFNFELSDQEMRKINNLHRGIKAYPFMEECKDHPFFQR